jgi:Na+/melibiose symporter-like transporter
MARQGTHAADHVDDHWEAAVGEIENLATKYRGRARLHKIWFWASGVLIILLSATLPFLAGLDFGGKEKTIGIIAVVIAALTGLRSFFHWDQSWSLLRQTDFELTELIRNWRLDKQAALREPESQQPNALDEITREFLAEARRLRRAESVAFFGRLTFPKRD